MNNKHRLPKTTKETRKPVPKPRHLEGLNPTVTAAKAFLKEVEDHHAGSSGGASTANMINKMRREPHLSLHYFTAMIDRDANEALFNNVRTHVERM